MLVVPAKAVIGLSLHALATDGASSARGLRWCHLLHPPQPELPLAYVECGVYNFLFFKNVFVLYQREKKKIIGVMFLPAIYFDIVGGFHIRRSSVIIFISLTPSNVATPFTMHWFHLLWCKNIQQASKQHQGNTG